MAAAAQHARAGMRRLIPARHDAVAFAVARVAVVCCGKADIPRGGSVCVSLPRAVARLARGVLIAAHMVLPEVAVAERALLRAHGLSRVGDGVGSVVRLFLKARPARNACREGDDRQRGVPDASPRDPDPTSTGAQPASPQRMSSSRAWKEAPFNNMWTLATALSWHEEQTDATGEMFKSSLGSIRSAPVSIEEGEVAAAASVL